MDFIAVLKADIENGFNKRDLERRIGLPKNSLSAVLSGKRKLSKIGELKVERWQKSEKPDPLAIKLPKNTPPAPPKKASIASTGSKFFDDLRNKKLGI